MRDSVMLATVASKSGTDLQLYIDGHSGTAPAIDCAGAEVADRVVVMSHNAQLLAFAVVGGGGGGITPADYVTERGTTSGWDWEKWQGGKAVARKRVHLYVSSWAAWGSIMESGQVFSGASNTYPAGLFAAAPSIGAELVNTPGASAYISGFEIGPNGTETRPPDVAVLRPTSAPAGYFDFDVISTGRWS